jgi:hypothetical protein
MENVPFSPNLYTTAWKFYQFYVMNNDLRDLRLKDIKTGLSSCRLPLLGMGLQKPI